MSGKLRAELKGRKKILWKTEYHVRFKYKIDFGAGVNKIEEEGECGAEKMHEKCEISNDFNWIELKKSKIISPALFLQWKKYFPRKCFSYNLRGDSIRFQ